MLSDNNIICKPVTPDLWPDLEQFFGKSGAYWGCWCMYWRCSNKEFQQMNSTDHKQALYESVTTSNHVPGLLAYSGDKPVGWIALGPLDDLLVLLNPELLSLLIINLFGLLFVFSSIKSSEALVLHIISLHPLNSMLNLKVLYYLSPILSIPLIAFLMNMPIVVFNKFFLTLVLLKFHH